MEPTDASLVYSYVLTKFHNRLHQRLDEETGNLSSRKKSAQYLSTCTGLDEGLLYRRLRFTREFLPADYVNGKKAHFPRLRRIKDKQRLTELNLIMNVLDIHDEDLHEYLRKIYPEFEFNFNGNEKPNNHPDNTLTASDVSRLEKISLENIDLTDNKYLRDPIIFVQDLAKKIDLDLKEGKVNRIDHNDVYRQEVGSWPAAFSRDFERKDANEHSLHVGIWFSDKIDGAFPPTKKISKLEEYLDEIRELNGKPFSKFDITDGKKSDFGSYAKDLDIQVHYTRVTREPFDESIAMMNAIKGESGEFVLSYLSTDWGSKEHSLGSIDSFFDNVRKASETDFRPYFHRAFELYKGIPKSQWHDPQMYTMKKKFPAEPKDTLSLTSPAGDFRTLDPLEFTREKAKEMGIKFRAKEKTFQGNEYCQGDYFVDMDVTQRELSDGGSIRLRLLMKKNEDIKNSRNLDYLEGRIIRYDDGNYHSFNLKKGKLSDFTVYSIPLRFEVGIMRTHDDGYGGDEDLYLCTLMNKNGEFGFSHVEYGNGNKEDKIFGRNFIDAAEIESFQKRHPEHAQDFRPWIHRVLETYKGVPRSEWHDPSLYVPNTTSPQLESVVNNTLDILFTGEERAALQNNLETAKLNMRKSWASIPRLSLGAIKLPTPGQRSIERDEFVMNAAPFFVEYLSSLGVMESDEAERLMAQ
ncbi:MAG: hypothetical protein RL557_529, partial [archaeon]